MAISRCHFIIPAGGLGSRFGADIPKQFVEVAGKAILLHTLATISPYCQECIVAVPQGADTQPWGQKVLEAEEMKSCQVIVGGETRYHSVRNALERVPDGTLVAVHDAVRPFIAGETIEALIATAQKYGAAIPIKYATDSLRRILDFHASPQASEPLPRHDIVQVETPQIFRSELLKEAYSHPYSETLTDDSSLYEAHFKTSPALVVSRKVNSKITFPEDRLFLEAILARKMH